MLTCVNLVLVCVIVNIGQVASQCDSTHYHVTTTGISDTAPNPVFACRGVPFFPEYETNNNRKYFRVKSGTSVAVYLTQKPQIYDRYNEDFYQLELDVNGDVRIVRNGANITPQSISPASNLLSGTDFTDLWVSVVKADGTIHLGRKDGDTIASWKDTDLLDVNYILVQNYNDADANTALWEFCDSDLKLLSQNQLTTKNVMASQRETDNDMDKDSAVATNAIDGKTNDGTFSEFQCIALGDELDLTTTDDGQADAAEVTDGFEEFAWWRIDLQDMYHIKAVSIVDSVIESSGCDKGWRRFGPACYYEGLDQKNYDNAEADCVLRGGHLATVSTAEVQAFLEGWLTDAPETADGYWIGLNDKTTANTYVWEDGTPGFVWAGGAGGTIKPTAFYSNWLSSQPNDGANTEQCVLMRDMNNLQWNDRACTVVTKYVCQKWLCDSGWQLFGEHCYYRGTTTTMSWSDAQTDCSSKGGHLATVNSAIKQAFMLEWLDITSSDAEYWIGLNDMTPSDTYVWDAGDDPGFTWSGGTSGSTGAATPGSAYQNFFGSQPNNNGDCVELRDDSGQGFNAFEWNDRDCSVTNRYVCQKTHFDDSDENLVGAEIRVGSCDHTAETAAADQLTVIKKNHVCDDSITTNEVDLDRAGFWLFKECDTNYYGQYVYILKEATPLAWFSFCEVEIWGIEISDENKPKVGFTQQNVEDLEANLNTQTLTVMRTDGSADHPTCLAFDLAAQTGLANAAAGPGATAADDYNHDATLLTTTYEYDPDDPASMTFDVAFADDDCEEDPEEVGFVVVPQTTGVCAGDADATTYETITYTINNDDVTYYWESTQLEVNENNVTLTAKLTREGYTATESTAYVTTDGGDATANTDYVPIISGTSASEVVFGPTSTSENIVVTILDDNECEKPTVAETFNLVATATAACQVPTDTATVTIKPDDVTFSFQNGPYTLSETDNEVEVVVERDGYLDSVVMIDVKSQPLVPTASATTDDYTAIDTTLTFPAGISTASVTVVATDDSVVEADEIFDLVLVKNPLTLSDCILEDPIKTDVTITDNDCYWSMMLQETSVLEDAGTKTITILCERDDEVIPNRPRSVTVQVDSSSITDGTAATAGNDFTSSASTTVTINAGQMSTTIEVPIADDILEEAVEYFDVTLVSSNDGELREPLTTRVAINDDDVTVRLTTCDVDGDNILEDAGKLTVTLERTGDLAESDSVLLFTNPLTATAGEAVGEGDYVSVTKVLHFSAMEPLISHDIIINDDNIYETEEEFVVQIKKQNDETFIDQAISRCIVTIQDDDCSFAISIPDDDKVVSEGDGEISFTITRSGYTEYSSSVSISTFSLNDPLTETDASPGVDYGAITEPRNVTFEPGQTSHTVEIRIIDDPYPEINEYFAVLLTKNDCIVYGDSTIVIGIEDNDEVEVSMQDDSVTVDENAGVAYVSVLRSGSLARTDFVALTLVPQEIEGISSAATINSDFKNDAITIEFEQSEEKKTVEIPIIDDEIEEVGLESFVVRIKEVKQNPAGGITVTDATIDDDNRETVVYIRDDDGTFSLRSLGRYSESVGSITITVDRTGPTTEEQTVYISTRNDGASSEDYQSLVLLPLTFAVGASSASLSLNIYDDNKLEGSEDFLVCWSEEEDRNKEQCVEIVTIEDDDNEVKFRAPPGTTATDNAITVGESEGMVHLTVERLGFGSSLPTGRATVSIATREVTSTPSNGASPADGNGVDYNILAATVVFPDRQSRLDVQIEIVDDEVGENQEVFEVVLTGVSPDHNNFIAYPYKWTVYINDDDGGAPGGGDGGDGTGDGGDGTGDGSDGGVSKVFIIGLGGGIGLLVLISVLGLIGCFVASRSFSSPAAPQTLPQRLPTAYRPGRGPVGPPPSYTRRPLAYTNSQALR